jgi:nicotinamide-nucleotide amidase
MVEIINTGSELLIGRTLNTHQQWLCRRLSDLGYTVGRQTAVPDTADAIAQATTESLSRAELVIVTGGLGPTSDDLTRDRIAALVGVPLVEDPAVVAHIEAFFTARKRVTPARTRVQAQVPQGARVLTNSHGTAPGLALKISPNPFHRDRTTSWLILLPGPPRELRPMFDTEVVPLLQHELPVAGGYLATTFKTTGLGESLVEERVADPLAQLVHAGLELGYCARVSEVEVRLAARGADGPRLVETAARIVQETLGPLIFSQNGNDLETVVVRTLTRLRRTLVVAESCTGGLLGHRITNVPGASAVFLGGWITYSNAAKVRDLGVPPATIDADGAVSEAVANEMAAGARRTSGADYALAITGIAGPSGGSEAKPVGTAFVALATSAGAKARRVLHPYDRETFKFATSQYALDMLRRELLRETREESPG